MAGESDRVLMEVRLDDKSASGSPVPPLSEQIKSRPTEPLSPEVIELLRKNPGLNPSQITSTGAPQPSLEDLTRSRTPEEEAEISGEIPEVAEPPVGWWESLLESIVGKTGIDLESLIPSVVSSAVTKMTGSPLLGAAAGGASDIVMPDLSSVPLTTPPSSTTPSSSIPPSVPPSSSVPPTTTPPPIPPSSSVPPVIPPIPPAAVPIALGIAAALIASELNNKIAEVTEETLVGGAENLFTSERADPLTSNLTRAQEATKGMDPLQALTGINLQIHDDLMRAFAEGLKTAIKGLDDMAEGMTEFSGDVAGATAEAENRRIMTELNRAERLGPDMARWVEARSEASESIEEIKIMLLQEVLPLFANAAENLAMLLKAANLWIRMWESLETKWSIAFKVTDFAANMHWMTQILNMLRKWLRNQLDEADKMDVKLMEDLEEFLDPKNFLANILPGMNPPAGGAGAGGP